MENKSAYQQLIEATAKALNLSDTFAELTVIKIIDRLEPNSQLLELLKTEAAVPGVLEA